jgi:sulfhydrogenase subunit alpha
LKNVTIDVKHVTRVEGHGNIAVSVKNGEITRLQLAIVESPRYFEAFLRGRRWYEAPHLTCRICGICSVGHTCASVQAAEAGAGIEITEQSRMLRKLTLNGEELQSHYLHVLFLAVPDFMGVGSVIPLASTHPEVVKTALRLKKLANDICGTVAGRHIHPIAITPGGVTHFPRPAELIDLKRRLEESRADLRAIAEVYATFPIPDFKRETEYLCLRDDRDGEYAFYDGKLVSTLQPEPTEVSQYRTRVIEEVVQHSAAKHCKSPNSPQYAVGALARFNNNHERLHPEAKKLAGTLGLKPICYKPFHNNTAQLVECAHCTEHSIELIDELLTRGIKEEPLVKPTKFGKGIGSSDVPRGILFHEYEFDKNGTIIGSNLIIPTGQNLANIEEDMRTLVPIMLEQDKTKEEMTLMLEMLVRAYDPCISCSTHFLNVEWVD